MTVDIGRVREIAEGVRAAFEKIASKEDWPSDLGGLCARAAAQIHLACARAGIDVMMWKNYYHAFNECDGWIVDVTATQFGDHPRVMVIRADQARDYYHVREDHVESALRLLKHFGGSFAARDMSLDGMAVRRELGF